MLARRPLCRATSGKYTGDLLSMPICSVEEAVADIKAGRMIILVDDEDRENEGDLTIAAEFVTPAIINFMVTHARGLVCLSLGPELAEKLELTPMSRDNQSRFGTNFTVSIEARHGVSTGISAKDRAVTILAAVADDAKPGDLVTPGHIFPIKAQPGGVLARAGQTEGSVDLARLAGLKPAGVICEIMREDGEMARLPELIEFAKAHNLKIATIRDIIRYRLERGETSVRRAAEAKLPTPYGDFKIIAYESSMGGEAHVALIMGDISGGEPVLTRVHSECLTGDSLHSLRCDCGKQLDAAMAAIAREGRGVILYMRQEGRGIGLANKIRAYALQDEGLDTVEANNRLGFQADLREYGLGAQMLVDLGVRKMRLLTNNPKKVVGLEGYGLTVEERVPLELDIDPHSAEYMRAKKEKLGHLLKLQH